MSNRLSCAERAMARNGVAAAVLNSPTALPRARAEAALKIHIDELQLRRQAETDPARQDRIDRALEKASDALHLLIS